MTSFEELNKEWLEEHYLKKQKVKEALLKHIGNKLKDNKIINAQDILELGKELGL